MTIWLTDPVTKQPSVTLTAFVWGFAVCTVKLLIGDVAYGALNLGHFGGGEYSAAIAALGGVYVMRRNLNANTSTTQDAKNAPTT
jgi:tetrahydromethanopterin S-methyltransferase subunit E